jgi:DNA gyrase subunit B
MDENELYEALINHGSKDFIFKTAKGTTFKNNDLRKELIKIVKVNNLLDKIPDRYDKKILEQIAIAGCLDVKKFDNKDKQTKEVAEYIAERINISAPDFDRGWQGTYGKEKGFTFIRELRGVSESIKIDNDLLHSQIIENINNNYDDLYAMFQGPGSLINGSDEEVVIYSPSQLLEKIMGVGKKGVTLQRYKGLGEMNPEQLWETTLDPNNRSLLQVKIEDVEVSKGIFEDLMGENVLPRKEFIESRAGSVVNLDI